MSNKIENLDQVKAKLYELFNAAVEHHGAYANPASSINGGEYGGRGTPDNFAIKNRIAIGTLAQAIATVEHEQREAKDAGFRPLEGKP